MLCSSFSLGSICRSSSAKLSCLESKTTLNLLRFLYLTLTILGVASLGGYDTYCTSTILPFNVFSSPEASRLVLCVYGFSIGSIFIMPPSLLVSTLRFVDFSIGYLILMPGRLIWSCCWDVPSFNSSSSPPLPPPLLTSFFAPILIFEISFWISSSGWFSYWSLLLCLMRLMLS